MVRSDPGDLSAPGTTDPVRRAEAALKRLGYSRVPPGGRDARPAPDFWVQEAGVPRRTFPVFLGIRTGAAPGGTSEGTPSASAWPNRSIVVVDGDGAAERAWQSVRSAVHDPAAELSILVLPESATADAEPRWHRGTVSRRELLTLATGVVVGMFRRAADSEGPGQLDFSEMLELLQQRFGVDVRRSLGVDSDEEALFILYQLAQRFAYAPGDTGSSLHTLVLKPVGQATKVPWFAA